jgi:hypothetical protein
VRARETIALLVLLGIVPSAPASARPRIDLVLLGQGDRVTGEIIRLEGATLSVRTLAFGTVDVDWPDVIGLVSIQLFEVERADGVRFVGSLDTGESGGVLVVRPRQEAEAVAIPLEQVVGIDQLGTNLWTSRRGYVDLGWTFAQANTDTSLSVGAELALHGKRFRWTNTLSGSLSDDANNEQRQREVLQSMLEVPIGKRFALLGTAQHERNDDLGLVARDGVSGVVAWLPVNGPRGRVVLGPGVAESRESYAERAETSVVTSGAFLLAGEYHRFGRFGTRAELSLLWLPVVSGPDRNRVEARAALRQKMGNQFTLALSPYYSYDSQPPVASAPTEDWGWQTTIGWTF